MCPLTDLDAAQFTLSQIASAADIGVGTLKNWFYVAARATNREPTLILDDRDPSRGRGFVRLFTLRRALQAAIVTELVNIGVEPRVAGPAARKFTDSASNIPSGWRGEGPPDIASMRLPGELFKDGVTRLVLDGNSHARVVDEEAFSEIVRRETAFTAINLNRIVERVRQRLGIDLAGEAKSAET